MRHEHDFYETAQWQTKALVANQRIDGQVLEPCVGDSSIATFFHGCITNDIDSKREADYSYDAASPALYDHIEQDYGQVDWVVTNPPFSMPLCRDIVALAVERARVGVAMMLRISFREPTAKINPRGPFLAAHPISRLLTLPRYSFTGNGKSDSATTEWVIWIKDPLYNSGLPILSLYGADAY